MRGVTIQDGLPSIQIDSFFETRTFPLTPEPIRFERCEDKRLMRMYGPTWEITSRSEKPTAYVWGATHVDWGSFLQFYDVRAQVNFIRHIQPYHVLHEFFLNVVYDPATKKASHHHVPHDTRSEYLPSDYEDHCAWLRRIEESKHLEAKIMLQLSDLLGYTFVGCDTFPSGPRPYFGEREEEQARVIAAFKGTPEHPCIAIIGGWHLARPGSVLIRELDKTGIDYATIIDVDNPPRDPATSTLQENMVRYFSIKCDHLIF